MKFLILSLFIVIVYSCSNTPESRSKQSEEDKADYFLERATYHYYKGELDSVLFYSDTALNIIDYHICPIQLTHLRRLKGSTYARLDSLDSAIETLRLARHEAINLENDSIQAMAELHLGWTFSKIDDKVDSVLIMYNHALFLYKKNKDTVGMAKILNNLAIYYKDYTNYDKALEAALQSYSIFKKGNDSLKIIISLINLGNIYLELGEYDTSMSCFNKSYDLAFKSRYDNLSYTSMSNIAVIYYKLGRYDEALDVFNEVIEYAEKQNKNRVLARYYMNVSLIYDKLDNVSLAFEYVNKSLELSRKYSFKKIEIKSLNNLGLFYKEQKNYFKSIDAFNQSFELSKNDSSLMDMRNAVSNMANVSELTGNYKDAYFYRLEYSKINDKILNKDKQMIIGGIKSDFYVLQLKDKNRINEMEKQKIRFERNLSFGLGITGIVLLILIVIALRNRARKNRIISAQRIQQLEDEKRILAAQSVIVGQEEERKRIAQELHDGIGVLLSTASMHFSNLSLDDDPAKTRKTYSKATKMLNEASKEVRKVSHNMMPGVLSKFGLNEAIEDLFETIEETGAMHTEVTMECKKERLPENLEIMIYRVVQEMINNTIKHAEASTIKCKMKRTDSDISIHFADDGKGFNSDVLPKDRSLGIFGIRSRVDFLGGIVNLQSKPGSGTSYDITIPLVQKSKRPKK